MDEKSILVTLNSKFLAVYSHTFSVVKFPLDWLLFGNKQSIYWRRISIWRFFQQGRAM